MTKTGSAARQLAPLIVLVIAIAGGSLVTSAQAASTYTVNGFGDSTATCAGTVCPSLRAAVAVADADPGSTIQLGPGAYTLSLGQLKIIATGSGVSIVGAGAGQTSIAQTDGHDRVLGVGGGAPVTLAGVTITGGALVGLPGAGGAPGGNALGAAIFKTTLH